jgi:hypothetical protein
VDEAVTTEDQKDEESKKGAHLVSMSHADVVHCTCSSTCYVDRGFSGEMDFGHTQHIDSAQVFLTTNSKLCSQTVTSVLMISLFVVLICFILLYMVHG